MQIFYALMVIVGMGFLVWLAETYIPMDAGLKQLLRIVAVILIILWLLQSFGVLGNVGGHINGPRVS